MNTKTILSILVLVAGPLIATSAHAQVAISEDGVTFPDDSAQYTAVPNDCPHSESIVWDTDAQRWVCESELSPIAYDIGDIGPAGGWVFYVTDGGLHGLEAAPVDQASGRWGCFGFSISAATATVVGTGAGNTLSILGQCFEADRAARIAHFYSLNGHSDWFLPSKDELDLMYKKIGQGNAAEPDVPLNVGSFANDAYWSSSEDDVNDAWAQIFGNGIQGDAFKDAAFLVRAARVF